MTRRTLVLASALSIALESSLLGQNPAQTPVEIAEDSAATTGAFGLEDQELFVPATDFHPVNGDWLGLNQTLLPGYWMVDTDTPTLATLSLPAGARIETIRCYFAYLPSLSSGTTEVDLIKYSYDLTSNSATAAFTGPTIESLEVGGLHVVSASFVETVRYRVGFEEYHYQLRALHGFQVPFRGCKVTWRRQVSTAPVSATFSDVPTSHPYYRFVEALVASGITAGCGGGNYCVNNPITRGEMAVFLAAALGLHFPN